jgi:hypothetical protein
VPNTGRTNRGRETEFLLADWLKQFYPDAYATNKSAPGVDIANTGRLALEVKATSKQPLLAALDQAHVRSSGLEIPVVVWRPNGYGAARLDSWVVALRAGVFFKEFR